jgi:ribosomal protein S13
MVKRVCKISYFKIPLKKSSAYRNKVISFLGKDYRAVTRIEYVFHNILGLGSFFIKLICKQFNITSKLFIGFFTDDQLIELKDILFNGSFLVFNKFSFFGIAGFWKKKYINSFLFIKQAGFLRFSRLCNGLPVRGQRTKTNAQRCRRSVARSISLSVKILFYCFISVLGILSIFYCF